MTDPTAGGAHGTQVPAAERAAEPLELRYLRHTRNAATFTAFAFGSVAVLSLVGAIVVGIQLERVSSQLSNLTGSVSSSCLSQGGTNQPGLLTPRRGPITEGIHEVHYCRCCHGAVASTRRVRQRREHQGRPDRD